MIQKDATTHVLLVGGGSGGHFYPLMAIAEALDAHNTPIRLFYAGPDQYDAEALRERQITFVHIGAGKQRRYASILNIFDFFRTLWGIFVALFKLYALYPDVIMSKGGYTSVPIVCAAWFLRIPIVVHESDAVMGRANTFAVHFARDIIVSYDELRSHVRHERVQRLGIPIRGELMQAPRTDAITQLGVDPNRPIVLVIGGSQGAERVNTLILDTLDELLKEYTVIHQIGKGLFQPYMLAVENLFPDAATRTHYHPFPFLDATQLNDAYHLAAVVISRAGSNSIYEISLHGKPAILIPIPEDVSHDQRTNAYAYARTGAATVIEEHNLTDSLLRSEIDRIMQDPALYTEMQKAAQSFGTPNAATDIAALIMEIAEYH